MKFDLMPITKKANEDHSQRVSLSYAAKSQAKPTQQRPVADRWGRGSGRRSSDMAGLIACWLSRIVSFSLIVGAVTMTPPADAQLENSSQAPAQTSAQLKSAALITLLAPSVSNVNALNHFDLQHVMSRCSGEPKAVDLSLS